ncbi:MAG: M28 family metallopeptidase [Gemmatimonadales bacterium]
MRFPAILASLFLTTPLWSQSVPGSDDPRIHDLVAAVSAARIQTDITKLVSFGTRSTLSDTLSHTRGIGAARRWIKDEFEQISQECGGCLEVSYISELFPAARRLPTPTNIVNVVAIQRGATDPNRMIIMSGDIDSRISLNSNAIDSAPGANDNASGMAGVLEAARVLTKYRFNGSVVYMGLSGEEQGLYGGGTVARYAREHGWNIEGVLNNDMIGNIEGGSGVIDNTHARVFSDGIVPLDVALTNLAGDGLRNAARDSSTIEVSATEFSRILRQVQLRRRTGGDVDGISRQLARYVDRAADLYIPNLDIMMVYRLDRFGRGGHHTPFANLGYRGVRIMEANENYTRQHQDIRVENGVHYGDVLEGVDFDYAAKLTALNAATMAALAWAPGPPTNVRISGAVRPSARMRWQPPSDAANVAGYRVYWRLTDSPTWDFSRSVGNVTDYTFEGLIIDNYFFGVAAVGADGNESVVVFPSPGR